MAFCNNQYPDQGTNNPNAAVGFNSGTVTIKTEGIDITYPTIVIDGNGTTPLTTPLEWFGANLIGAAEFGLTFSANATIWIAQDLAAGPAYDTINSESKDIELASNSANLCRAGYLYKPACISKINQWLDSDEAIKQIGSGWRVATETDFRNLEIAIGTTNAVYKVRTEVPVSSISSTTFWSNGSPATPAGVTLNYSGFNAFAPGARVIPSPGTPGSINTQARLAAWWAGPSNGDPNGTDNKFGANTKSVSAWYRPNATDGPTSGSNMPLRYNTSVVLELGSTIISNEPRTGNSIRLVRDYVNPTCTDLTTSNDALNRAITYDSVSLGGVTYPTLWIGAQKWVAANLIGSFGIIPYTESQSAWNNLSTEGYSYYNAPNDLLECYNGHLYNGYAATAINNRLIATSSLYRVPSTDDYNELVATLGLQNSTAGGELKTDSISTTETYWNDPNTAANNSSGFSGVGAGIRGITGSTANYSDLKISTSFWTRTAGASAGLQQSRSLSKDTDAFDLSDQDIKYGFSVRLLIPSIPVNVIFAGAGSGTVGVIGSDSAITNTSPAGYTIRLRNGENALIAATPNPNSVVTSITAATVVGNTPVTITGGQIAALSEAINVTVTFGIFVPPSIPNEWEKQNLCVGDRVILNNYNCDIVSTVAAIVMNGININQFDVNPFGDPCTISFSIPQGVDPGTVTVDFYNSSTTLLESLPFSVVVCGGDFFGPDEGAPACSTITYTNSDCSIIQDLEQLYINGVLATYAVVSNTVPCQILIVIPALEGNFPTVVKVDFYADGILYHTESYLITANCDGEENGGDPINPNCLELLETDNLTFVDCQTGQVVPFEEGTVFKRTGWTVSFSTELGVWESRHTYLPYMYMYNTKAMYTLYREFSVDSFWKHTERVKRLLYYGRPVQDNFELEIIFPGEDRRTTTGTTTTKNSNKIFSAFAISADSFEDGLDMMRNKYNLPFTEFYVYNSFQISGLVNMEYLNNVRRVDGSWVINEFRDLSRYGSANDGLATLSPGLGEQMFLEEGEININYISSTKEWYDKRKFVDKWIGLRLIYNPSITNSNVDLVYLYNVVFNSRQSFR